MHERSRGTEDPMPDTPEKQSWALVVGIDEYTKFTALDGCVNDAKLWAKILAERFGFQKENVRVLLNGDATRQGILDGMKWLADSAGRDHVVVFTYSGHGSQMTDRENDELDGMDETLVPIDSGRAPAPNRDITDDEIHQWLLQVGEKTPHITLLFDCCHSATAARDASSKERRAQPDNRAIADLPPSPIAAGARGAGGTRGGSNWLPMSERYVLLAGCRDDESSYEHVPDDGETHGALTYFLSAEILRASRGATYRDVMERAAAQVTASKTRQHPQLEGAGNRVLFGTEMRPPQAYLLVTKRSGQQVTVDGGAAHGLTKDSEWTICEPDVARLAEAASPVGRVRIGKPGVVATEAEIIEERAEGAIAAGQRAFETLHNHGDMRLAVQVIASDAGRRAAMEQAIGKSTFVSLVDSPHSDAVRVMLIGSRDVVKPDDPLAAEGPLAEPSWVMLGSDGNPLMPLRPDGDDAIKVVVANLETRARYRNALAIRNPNPDSKLASRLDFVLKRMNENKQWVTAEPDPATGQVVIEDGELVGFEITSRHDKTLYISVLDFGLASTISILHPPEGPSEQLEPGITCSVAMREGDQIVMELPENLPRSLERGTEVFRLCATEVPADLRPLVQSGVRAAGETAVEKSPLEILSVALTNVVNRDARRVVVSPSDWTVVDRAFTMRRKKG